MPCECIGVISALRVRVVDNTKRLISEDITCRTIGSFHCVTPPKCENEKNHGQRLVGVLVHYYSMPVPGFHSPDTYMYLLRDVIYQVIADASDDLSGRKRSDPAQAIEVRFFAEYFCSRIHGEYPYKWGNIVIREHTEHSDSHLRKLD